jgi:hypothetical protein
MPSKAAPLPKCGASSSRARFGAYCLLPMSRGTFNAIVNSFVATQQPTWHLGSRCPPHRSSLFNDVGQLYGLRSKLVHGGQIRQKDLRKIIARIMTVPTDAGEYRFGVALGYAVDRMRGLVRRAILARLCLAAEPDPLWPFEGDTAVDAILDDDA